MDRSCYHHPDKEAAGNCCYCDRPLCEECLFTNRQGKSYCRREEECLAYQDAASSPGKPTSPVMDGLIDEATLEAQVKRISQILEELEELKGLLEDVEATGGTAEFPAAETEPSGVVEPDPSNLGFCAWKLVEEALALAGLLSFRVAFIQKERGPSGSPVMSERASEIGQFLEQEADPKIRALRDWARRYSSVDVADLPA